MSELGQADGVEPISQLHPDALGRLSDVLGRQLPDVFSKHREVESKTGRKNNIGRQNLVEALAHLSVLFQRSSELDRDGQLAQVAYLEDHLRRTMMESFELATYDVIGDLRDSKHGASLERRYYARAAPLIRIGRLPGHITPDQVSDRFEGIAEQCVAARAAKVADAGWDAWKTASDQLQDAAENVEGLQRDMRAAVDAAHASWRFALGTAIAVVLFVLSHVFF